MLVVGTALGVYCSPVWGVRSYHILSLTARIVQRPFPGKCALHNVETEAGEQAESAQCALYTLDPLYR